MLELLGNAWIEAGTLGALAGVLAKGVPERSMIKVIQWASTLGRRAAIGLGDGGRKAGGLDADTAERRGKC